MLAVLSSAVRSWRNLPARVIRLRRFSHEVERMAPVDPAERGVAARSGTGTRAAVTSSGLGPGDP
jgi:hypothetical protein